VNDSWEISTAVGHGTVIEMDARLCAEKNKRSVNPSISCEQPNRTTLLVVQRQNTLRVGTVSKMVGMRCANDQTS